MKKIFPGVFILLTFFSCQKNASTEFDTTDEVQVISKRSCAANDVLQEQIIADPSLRTRMDQVENFTKKVIATGNFGRLVNGVIEIPVVVNVLYKTTAENISAAQIQSQIDVLNADYNNTNSDINQVPSAFTSSIGKVGIKFVLLTTIRKATNKKSWGTNDAMKKSSLGGIDPTDPARNICGFVT